MGVVAVPCAPHALLRVQIADGKRDPIEDDRDGGGPIEEPGVDDLHLAATVPLAACAADDGALLSPDGDGDHGAAPLGFERIDKLHLSGQRGAGGDDLRRVRHGVVCLSALLCGERLAGRLRRLLVGCLVLDGRPVGRGDEVCEVAALSEYDATLASVSQPS